MQSFKQKNEHELRTDFTTHLIEKYELSEIQAQDLEIGILNWTIDYFVGKSLLPSWQNLTYKYMYKHKAYQILKFITHENNYLITKIKNGEIKPHSVIGISHLDIDCESWHSLIQSEIKKNIVKQKGLFSITKLYRCKRCWKRNPEIAYDMDTTTMKVNTMQNRSGDEAPSNHLECLGCGYNFRIG